VTLLAWSDKVPNGWAVMPLRSVAEYVVSNVDKVPVDGEQRVQLCNYSDVYNNEFIDLRLEFMWSTATTDEIRKFGLVVGDVIITKDSESWDDIGIPALVCEAAANLVCGYHLALIRPRPARVLGRFLLRCLQAKPLRIQLELAANGVTRYGLPKSDIGAMRLPVPPVDEQQAIANFLDRETSRLDALVAAKQRVLDLLAEKRKAIIATAVTRGLDGSMAMRRTSVEWMPNAPAHWRTSRVGRLFRQSKVLGFPDLTALSVYREYGVVERASRDDNSNRLPDDLEKYQLVEPGDLVVNKMKAWQGSLGISDFRGITSPDYVVFRPTHGEERAFLHFLLRTQLLTTVYLSMSNGIRINQWRIEPDRFVGLPVFLPPLDEQRAIVEHIARETSKLDAVRAATERTIALLKERRSALIAAAVTGQIDVGGAA